MNGPHEYQSGMSLEMAPIKRTTQIVGRGEGAFASYDKGMRTISMNSATVSPQVVSKFHEAVGEQVRKSAPVVEEQNNGATGAV